MWEDLARSGMLLPFWELQSYCNGKLQLTVYEFIWVFNQKNLTCSQSNVHPTCLLYCKEAQCSTEHSLSKVIGITEGIQFFILFFSIKTIFLPNCLWWADCLLMLTIEWAMICCIIHQWLWFIKRWCQLKHYKRPLTKASHRQTNILSCNHSQCFGGNPFCRPIVPVYGKPVTQFPPFVERTPFSGDLRCFLKP